MRKIYAPATDQVTEEELRHRELARKMAGECVVLLENDGVLPLMGGGKIALFGMGANYTVKGGTGSGDVNSRSSLTVEEGLIQKGWTVTSTDWLARNKTLREQALADHNKKLAQLQAKTGYSVIELAFTNPFQIPDAALITQEDMEKADTDTAIYVIARNSGEGADRWDKPGDYRASARELEDLRILAAHFKKVVLLLNIGGVMDLSEIRGIDGVGAIVLMGQLGNIGGLAIADVLDGTVNPSGRLADTWAKSYADYPSSATFSHNNGNLDDDDYTEWIYVGYRYFDTYEKELLYPFGYGRSYTEFAVAPEGAELAGTEISLRVRVTNTGTTYAGKEVVQVYVSAPEGSLDKPAKELKAYGKTKLLRPGTSQELTLSVRAEDLASYSEEKAAWILEPGDYRIYVGKDAEHVTPAAILRLDAEAVTQKVRNLFAADPSAEAPMEELRGRTGGDRPACSDGCGSVPVLELSSGKVRTQITVYTEPAELPQKEGAVLTLQDVRNGVCTAEELVSQLSVREMAALCTGRFAREGETSIIGMASMVPGGAGDTNDYCEKSRGIRPLIMADGPAGLRLQPHFKARTTGEILPGGAVFGDSTMPFPEYENPESVEDHYQYTTAIPIGWALAQSWNTELIEQTADMVGQEMETFGIDIWLAPAMNIHRNPLCGRNFEYYSEDPLVSGLTAAAITRGVQSHPGKAVCIKHFAANNQEENRYCTNANICERALREIYLKGFEICIRTAHPISIMTSYNMINGIHAANSRELLQYAARDEWGFDGFIMTDWFATERLESLMGGEHKYTVSDPAGAVYAGNDVQMPGSQSIENAIVEAAESGVVSEAGFAVTKAELQSCALHVIEAVLRCGELQ